jgi:monothiol glutaredoxin
MALDQDLRQRLDSLVNGHKVVLFMKGTRHFPQCGFSATVTQILSGLVPEYETVNVLKEPEIREGIKEYSEWPTIPQLYVDGKFVGGCDIVREMYLAGELQPLLGVKEELTAPVVTLTEAAANAVRAALHGEEGALRLAVNPRFEYEMSVDEPQKGDFEVKTAGVTVLVDRDSSKRADGIRIDYSEERGGGFKIENPNEPPRVKPLMAPELKAWLDEGRPLQLVDVRTEQERELANIEGSRLLDDGLRRELQSLDKDTVLVFTCHSGSRSQMAAQQFVTSGFKRVYNLEGGIDAWSTLVDPGVPRY